MVQFTLGIDNSPADVPTSRELPADTSPIEDRSRRSTDRHGPPTLRGDVEELERQKIMMALEDCSGNQTRAAKQLGMSRNTLLRKLDRYCIPRPRKGR